MFSEAHCSPEHRVFSLRFGGRPILDLVKNDIIMSWEGECYDIEEFSDPGSEDMHIMSLNSWFGDPGHSDRLTVFKR